ncbi:MAG TPA: putative baseplate assembly protein [Abditibacteriaceae bacterium]|nr:putative baseplate assembly protein [Abditibacteriaceae bacterium]
MNDLSVQCGCCEGVEKLTPLAVANRPGLDALFYRVGTHGSFLETMRAALSSVTLEIPLNELDAEGHPKIATLRPLAGLSTRAASDPAIALLDAWALVADVLTFYQERIANEGFLRTATERRSILELARLVGYSLRPGVAASGHLAYTLDKDSKVEIAADSGAQSVPGPGELPQYFETSDPLEARTEWNNLQVRLTRPHNFTTATRTRGQTLYFKGIATGLKPNDPVLIDHGANQEVYRVQTVTPDALANRTKVVLQPWLQASFNAAPVEAVRAIITRFSATENFDVASSGRTARRVLGHLEQLRAGLTPDMSRDAFNVVLNDTLTRLSAAHDEATGVHLKPWIGGMVTELQAIVAPSAPAGAASTAAEATTGGTPDNAPQASVTDLSAVLDSLTKRASLPPRNSQRLARTVAGTFGLNTDMAPQLLTAFQPRLQTLLYRAWANTPVVPDRPVEVHALRTRASVFGHNAPLRPVLENGTVIRFEEWTLHRPSIIGEGFEFTENPHVVSLDASYSQVIPGGWVVLERPQANQGIPQLILSRVQRVSERSRADYNLNSKGTQLHLQPDRPWLVLENGDFDDQFDVIRGTSVLAQSEVLELAEAPIDPVREAICGQTIELDGLYDGLQSGRWLIVSGERTDVVGESRTSDDIAAAAPPDVMIQGVPAAELVMLDRVEQAPDPNLPGDKTHSRLHLANPLAYCYKRDTVTLYGNVVAASHGETRREVLGSGDGSRVLQAFALRQSPLTYVAAPTPAGAQSTLEVRVNEVLWHEARGFTGLKPKDRRYVTKTDDAGQTTVIFGNGQEGARLPTGVENIRAVYRTSIGQGGNLAAGRVSQLATRPLGVSGVTNPLAATGGADAESRDQARHNAPLGVTALDRLVSVRDYADFARTFAGIGKASAARLSDGRRQLVHLTIAGANDIPLAETSALFRNLQQALQQFGDPYQPFEIESRALRLLVISARVRLQPDYLWELVEPKIRTALLDAFSFERRDLGQDVVASEVISVIQKVAGVAYVDLDVLDALDEKTVTENLANIAATLTQQPQPRIVVDLARVTGPRMIEPAQLAMLSPQIQDTLLLTEVPA